MTGRSGPSYGRPMMRAVDVGCASRWSRRGLMGIVGAVGVSLAMSAPSSAQVEGDSSADRWELPVTMASIPLRVFYGHPVSGGV